MLKTTLQIKQILVTLLYYLNQNLLLKLFNQVVFFQSSRGQRVRAGSCMRFTWQGFMAFVPFTYPPADPRQSPAAVSSYKVFHPRCSWGLWCWPAVCHMSHLSCTVLRDCLGPRAHASPGAKAKLRLRPAGSPACCSLCARDSTCHLCAEPSLHQPEEPGVSISCS